MHGRGPTLARLDRPTAASTTLAVVADLHLATASRGTWKCFHRTGDRLRAVVREVNRLAVDGLVLAGDLTHTGRADQYDALRRALGDLVVPVMAVPGNNDLRAANPLEGADALHGFAPGDLPQVQRFGDVTVLGIDSAGLGAGKPPRHGCVGPDQREQIREIVDDADVDLAVLHHSLADEALVGGRGVPDPTALAGSDELAELLDGAGVDLAVSGHTHCPALGRRRGLREIVAPAACSFPPSFLLVHVEPRGTTVSMVPIVDRLGLEEAYQYALDGPDRARRIAEAFTGGYLDRFPLVDELDDEFPTPSAPGAADLVRLPR